MRSSRSVVSYAVKVQVYQCSEDAEKILDFFIKKIFGMQYNSRIYILNLEPELGAMYSPTVKLGLYIESTAKRIS